MARHRADIEGVIKDFETIRKHAEKEPEDTEELIKIQDYIKEVKETKLKQINVDLEGVGWTCIKGRVRIVRNRFCSKVS